MVAEELIPAVGAEVLCIIEIDVHREDLMIEVVAEASDNVSSVLDLEGDHVHDNVHFHEIVHVRREGNFYDFCMSLR